MAKDCEAALISSWDLDIVSFDNSSSMTLTDLAFSDLIWPWVWAATSWTLGMASRCFSVAQKVVGESQKTLTGDEEAVGGLV